MLIKTGTDVNTQTICKKKKKKVKKQNVFTMNNKKTIDTIKTVTKVNT